MSASATNPSHVEGRTPTVTALVKDVMTLVAQYCTASELLLLRHVSKDWSVVTHVPAAWISSHWQLQTWQLSESLIQSMPYLRSLTFPLGTRTLADLTITPEIYHLLSQLVYLERINSCQNPIYLPFSLVRLKHLEYHSPRHRITNTVFTDMQSGRHFVEPTEATTIQQLNGLRTLRILVDVDPSFRLHYAFWGTYLLSSSVSSLITLVIPISIPLLNLNAVKTQPIKWTTFSSLEECEFGACGEMINFQQLVQMPRLRMLTLQCSVSSTFMDGLFSNPAFNTRLEYFHVRLRQSRGPDADFFTSHFIHQVMTQFTSLLVLRLTRFKKRFVPLNRDDWSDRLQTLQERSHSTETTGVSCPSSDINDLEDDLCRRIWQRPSASEFWKSFWSHESRSLGCSIVNCGCLQVFSFGQLLTSPQPSARQSLRFIELPRRWKCAVGISDSRTLAPFPPSEIRQLRIQLMTRMPHLIQAQFGEYQSQPITLEDEAGHCTAKVTHAELDECRSWMNEPNEDVVDSPKTSFTTTANATAATHPTQPTLSSSNNSPIISTSSCKSSSPTTTSSTNDATAADDHPPNYSADAPAIIDTKSVPPVVERGSLTTNEWSYQSTSPFLFVRAIKLAVGLPLQPSESNADLLHRWES